MGTTEARSCQSCVLPDKVPHSFSTTWHHAPAPTLSLPQAPEKVTHIATELEKQGEHLAKNCVTPTLNRKRIASAVARSGSEADETSTAATHVSFNRQETPKMLWKRSW